VNPTNWRIHRPTRRVQFAMNLSPSQERTVTLG
jgi:hypothetical protein